MRKIYKIFYLCFVFYSVLLTGAHGQVGLTSNGAGTEHDKASKLELDLNTPTAPGFVVIGALPKGAADSGNLPKLVIDSAGFVEDGKLKPGLAITTLPYWWKDHEFTLEQYANHDNAVFGGLTPTERIAARTQLSIATVEHEAKNNKSGIKVGIGLQSQLLDSQDPRRDQQTIDCINQAWIPFGSELDDIAIKANLDAIAAHKQDPSVDVRKLRTKLIKERAEILFATYDIEYAKCKEAAKERFLRAPSLMVGAGFAGLTESGKSDDLEFDGASFWTTYRRPFGAEKKALVFFIKADIDREFEVAPKQMAKGDGFEMAISYALEQPTWKLEATASFQHRDFKNDKFDDDHFRFSVTGVYKLKENVWLETTWGTKTNGKADDENFGLVNLKTNLGETLSKLTK